jgi:osmoprotectant transport system permease protein
MVELLWEVKMYIAENPDAYLAAVRTHVFMCFSVLLTSSAAGIVLGAASAKNDALSVWIVNIFGTLRMIPSLALLIAMLPILGTGFVPGFIVLLLHSVSIVLINSYSGFKSVPPPVLESAEGMGLSRREILFRIEFPLAMPLIFTGIRTSAVDIISSGTLVAYIGAGGLGEFIVSGLSFMDFTIMMTGALSVAFLAVTTDIILSFVQKEFVWNSGKYA